MRRRLRAPIAAEWTSGLALVAALLHAYGLAIALLVLTPMVWAGWHRIDWRPRPPTEGEDRWTSDAPPADG